MTKKIEPQNEFERFVLAYAIGDCFPNIPEDAETLKKGYEDGLAVYDILIEQASKGKTVALNRFTSFWPYLENIPEELLVVIEERYNLLTPKFKHFLELTQKGLIKTALDQEQATHIQNLDMMSLIELN